MREEFEGDEGERKFRRRRHSNLSCAAHNVAEGGTGKRWNDALDDASEMTQSFFNDFSDFESIIRMLSTLAVERRTTKNSYIITKM